MVLKDERETSTFATIIQLEKLDRIQILQTPLVFSDKQPLQEMLSPIDGIRKYGPYDINTSDGRVLRKVRGIEFFVFYPNGEDKIREGLNTLMSMLEEGYVKRSENDVEFKGFEKEFRLKAFVPKVDDFIKYQPGNLQQKIEEIDFEEIRDRGNSPVAIVGGTTHRSVLKNRDQYLEAKREFTNLEIPSQYAAFYEYETGGAGILYQIGRKNLPLGYSLWNFALNIYGKIGGLPWIIRQRLSKNTDEIIDLAIGIRFAKSKIKRGFNIGYATIIDRFGRLIGVVSSPPFKARLETTGMVLSPDIIKNIVNEALSKAINDPRIKDILLEKESLNVALHRLSIFHPNEILGINLAVNERSKLDSLRIKIGLITISDVPSILVFNKASESWNNERGTAFMINNESAILYTTRAYGEEMSYPVTVIAKNLGTEKCPFKTLEEVCNHVFSLTNLHWQTVVPGLVKLPITLEFAKAIAQLSSYEIKPKEDSWLWRTLWFI
jgi:hypothetical protein